MGNKSRRCDARGAVYCIRVLLQYTMADAEISTTKPHDAAAMSRHNKRIHSSHIAVRATSNYKCCNGSTYIRCIIVHHFY